MWFSHVKRKGDSADFQVNICIEIPNNCIAVLEYEHTVCTRYMKSLCSESQNNKANTGSECH